jgi:hypothetical protein
MKEVVLEVEEQPWLWIFFSGQGVAGHARHPWTQGRS